MWPFKKPKLTPLFPGIRSLKESCLKHDPKLWAYVRSMSPSAATRIIAEKYGVIYDGWEDAFPFHNRLADAIERAHAAR